ncbi:hypothetical protein OAA60_04825 [Porticoccaceae bacterium]|nr:hypothetical protein [Porticoccaceae bacterium]
MNSSWSLRVDLIRDNVEVIGAAVGIIFLIAVVPLSIIWALNTLFPLLAIAYNFWTWLAVLILSGATHGKVKEK